MALALVQIRREFHAGRLPSLSDGFKISLSEDEWGALFPRHHLMWVSSEEKRVRDFVKQAASGYDAFLSEPMKESFGVYYNDPLERVAKSTLSPGSDLFDSTICFLPTNDCNLGCKYCFSGAQPKKFGGMPWEIAKAAVDLGVRNAIIHRMRVGHGQLTIRFFGGGEPTEYWETYSGIVDYARARAQSANIGVLVATITNGQIAEEHYEWFRENIDEVTISMDGPPDIQNAQRPTFAGEKSFEKSWNFLSRMDALGVNINAIRVTVTAQTVNRMVEIAEFFWGNLTRAYALQFEPVYLSEVGRQNTVMPRALEFVEQIRCVEEMARQRHNAGRRHAAIGTATRPLVIRGAAYCDSLEGRGLFVTPNGLLSLCSEVSVPNDPRKDEYFVGGYDRSTKRFHITERGASKIRCGSPWWCRGCYAKFSCSGGCEPRSQNSDVNVRKWWCQMVRANLRGTWADVRAGNIAPRARIGDPSGEELIWLPVWQNSPSMDG